MAIFKGAAVAIVTPMHEDGKVNYFWNIRLRTAQMQSLSVALQASLLH